MEETTLKPVDLGRAPAQPASPPAPPAPAGGLGGEYKEYHPLYAHFGVSERRDDRVNKSLAAIWRWARETTDDPSRDGILWHVRKLQHRLGDAPLGSAPWSKVANYVSTWARMREAERMLKEMEHA